jgi:hypothetical protein
VPAVHYVYVGDLLRAFRNCGDVNISGVREGRGATLGAQLVICTAAVEKA